MSRPDTEAQPFWKALKFVVERELTNQKAAATIIGKNGARLKVLKPLWLPRVRAKLQKIIVDCTANLPADQVTLVCNQAYDFVFKDRGMKLVTAKEDHDLMIATSPDTKDYGSSAAFATYVYLLDNCLYGSVRWRQYLDVQEAAQHKCTLVLDMCDTLDVFVVKKSLEQQQVHDKCTAAIAAVQIQVNDLTSVPGLGVHLKPLVYHCTQLLTAITVKIQSCTAQGYIDRTANLAFTFESDDDQTLVATHNWALPLLCGSAMNDLDEVSALIDPAVFTHLSQLLNTPLVKNFGLFLNALGGPAFEALLGLPDPDKVKFLGFWFDLAQEFLKQCPPGTDSSEILSYCMVANTATTTSQAIFAVMGGNMLRVTLPTGVASLGWRVVNTIKIPAAFSKGSYSTDQACMKHTKKEVGANPSLVKLTAYFADLVIACSSAANAWDGTDMFPYSPVVAGITWHIIVGSQGQKKIVHIDSGYQNSPWVNKAV
jgi:sulfur relay (sulfurtransferase) DsrF/TusC family protein